MHKLSKARIVRGFRVRLEFEDGTRGVVDLRPLLQGAAFESVRDPVVFRKLRVRFGTLVWPGDVDLSPEALYVSAALHASDDSAPAPAQAANAEHEHWVVFHRPDNHDTVYTFENEVDAVAMSSWLERLGVPTSRISRLKRVRDDVALSHAAT